MTSHPLPPPPLPPPKKSLKIMSFKLQVAEPLLPYALAFAAGAMIYVVVDDIIPEAQTRFDISVIFTAVFTNHVCLIFMILCTVVNCFNALIKSLHQTQR